MDNIKPFCEINKIPLVAELPEHATIKLDQDSETCSALVPLDEHHIRYGSYDGELALVFLSVDSGLCIHRSALQQQLGQLEERTRNILYDAPVVLHRKFIAELLAETEGLALAGSTAAPPEDFTL